jgi:hypothetical protein
MSDLSCAAKLCLKMLSVTFGLYKVARFSMCPMALCDSHHLLSALSHLAAASFKADKYGVVQKSLASVINILLTLQEARFILSSFYH